MRLTSIILPVLNRPDLVKACLQSVLRHTTGPYEIVAVDNGSRAGTGALLGSFPIRVLRNPRNLGFARAVNRGILASRGDVVVLLNTDVTVPRGWLEGMRKALTGRIGLVGPATDGTSNRQRRARASRTGRIVRLPILYGFCLMVRRRVFRDVGLLDERFFPGGFEDQDLCLRAAGAGWQCALASGVFVRHRHGGSWRANGIDRSRAMRLNEKRFLAKWKGDPLLGLYVRDNASALER